MSFIRAKQRLNQRNRLIEEIEIDEGYSDDPNFIMGDCRKAIVMEEMVLLLREIKQMMQDKRIDIQINVK